MLDLVHEEMTQLASRYRPEYIERIAQEFSKFGCAQIYDAAPEYCHVLPDYLLPRVSHLSIAGPAFPVATQNDMLPLLQALDLAPPGWVLFVRNDAQESEALAGDIFVTAMRSQRLGGLVVDGAVRDMGTLPALQIPVFSRQVRFVSAKTARIPAAVVPASLDYGHYTVEPGDFVFGDSDGMLLVKKKYLTAVIHGARYLLQRESALKARLDEGFRLAELVGLTTFLAGEGKLKFDV